MKDYYQILEIPDDATQDQIRAQYRFLVQAWHPDKFGSPESKAKAEERLKEINEAYSVLKDPVKRSEYDRVRIFSKSVAGSQTNNYSSDTTSHESEKNTERENQPRESESQRDYPKPSRKPQNKSTIGKTQTAVLLTSIFGIFLILFFVLGVAWTVWGQSTPTAIIIATQSITQRIDRTPTVSIVSSVTPTILNLSSSDEIIDNFEIPMKLVPAGKFAMGSNIGAKDEAPTHEIFLDSFYIDKYEVTNAQYTECITAGLCQPPKQYNSTTYDDYFTNPKFSNYPVIFVDWYMAKTYCEWRGARLPTEAEWEKAARGVDERVYPWGNTFVGTLLNSCDEMCAHESANPEFNDGHPDVAPVGLFEKGQSPYGVFDMAGNVWEWVGDWYSPSYYGEPSLQNPTGPSSGQYRVIRGGGWRDQIHGVRTSVRVYFEPLNAYEFLGFRCVKPIEP